MRRTRHPKHLAECLGDEKLTEGQLLDALLSWLVTSKRLPAQARRTLLVAAATEWSDFLRAEAVPDRKTLAALDLLLRRFKETENA